MLLVQLCTRGGLEDARNFLALFSLGDMKANNQSKQRTRYDNVADGSTVINVPAGEGLLLDRLD
jgi:hypothetical protein